MRALSFTGHTNLKDPTNPGWGENMSLRMIGSHMFESSINPYQADKIERAGLGTFPDWNATFNPTYLRGPLTLAWFERWSVRCCRT